MLSDSTVFTLAFVALFVSVFVNLYFANNALARKRRDKKRADQFKKQLRSYLKEQSRKSLNYKKDASIPDLDPIVSNVRGAYMLIESKAVERGIDSKSYWNLINAKVKNLIDIVKKYEARPTLTSIKEKVQAIKTIVSKSIDAEDKDTIFVSLDNFYQACLKSPSDAHIGKFDKKLNNILNSLKESNFDNLIEATDAVLSFSQSVKHTVNDHRSTTNAAFSESSDPPPSNDDSVRDLLGDYHNKSNDFDVSLNNVIEASSEASENLAQIMLRDQEGEGGSDKSSIKDELLEISETLQKQSETEIHRLKGVVKDQKNTIVELEDQLADLAKRRKDSNSTSAAEDRDHEHLESQVAMLKNCLRDSENCIKTLENELDTVKQKFTEISNATTQASDQSSSEKTAELLKKIKQLENELTSAQDDKAFLQAFFEFIKEANTLESIEDFAMQTYSLISELGVNAQLLVFGDNREFVVSPSGAIANSDLVILRNLSVLETSQNSKNTKLFTRYQHYAALLTKSTQQPFSKAEAIQLHSLLEVVEAFFARIYDLSAKQSLSKRYSESYENIKVNITEVDRTLSSTFDNLTSTIQTLSTDIQNRLRAQGASATQISKIKQFENDILNEVHTQKSVTLVIKRRFLKLLNAMDNAN